MKRHERKAENDVRQWVAKAEEDFGVAGLLTSHEDAPFPGPVCFHAQQCAEKYLKAFLVQHEVRFPRTHDIDRLLDLVEDIDGDLAGSCEEAEALTPYAVEVRYWADAQEVTADEAKRAVRLASKVRDAVRGALRDFLGEQSP